MKPISSAQLALLVRHPAAMARLLATGQPPLPIPIPAPNSPLIEALGQIPPRLRASMLGFHVGPDLGYMGSRVFPTAAQALLWLCPHHAGASHPAESWRDKRFHSKIWLDDILASCSSHHESMPDDLRHLMDPARRPPATPAAGSAPAPGP